MGLLHDTLVLVHSQDLLSVLDHVRSEQIDISGQVMALKDSDLGVGQGESNVSQWCNVQLWCRYSSTACIYR